MIGVDGSGPAQLTNDAYFDAYPDYWASQNDLVYKSKRRVGAFPGVFSMYAPDWELYAASNDRNWVVEF